ncbi:MAG: aminotransferase class I/II-fold pyridoxal phosphate-dependent enzyme [Pseudomonadota bacterium]
MTMHAKRRSDLLASLRTLDASRRGREAGVRGQAPGETVAPSAGPRRADFAAHPDYKPIAMKLRAAEAFGVASPYFRKNSGGTGVKAAYGGGAQVTFASYDYLGLNGHPEVAAAAKAAIDGYGISATASRVAGGERPYHAALEQDLAAAYGVEAAVVMVSGHATNVTTIGTLLGPKDLIICDALIHNSIAEGARLSGATRLSMPHNDLAWLDDMLSQVRGRHRHVLIAVEGLYSMDGDTPDLARLIEIKHRHDAWLMVDEAHALGVLGETGRGIAEAQGVDPREVDVWMGTLSKTLGACGGYICGSEPLIEFLKSAAPGFVFSVGIPAPVAAAAQAALAVMQREPARVAKLAQNGRYMLDAARRAGIDTGLSEGHAVLPMMTGDSLRAVRLSNTLLERGVNAMPIIFPAVPERQARLRFFLTSEHEIDQIDHAVTETRAILETL